MKHATLVWTIAFPFVFVVSTAAAQHGHGGSPKPSAHGSSAPKTTSHTTTKTTHGGSSHATKPAKTTSPKPVKTSSTKLAKTTSPKPAKATKPTKVAKADTTSKAGKTTKTAKTKNTTTTTTTSTTTLTPVQQKLLKNTKLASKLQSRLPAGTDLMTAAKGFKNFGQFNAAVNVSHNLGISFTELKTRMVNGHMSLGQAIQDVRPNTDAATIQRASGGQ
jgi:hypothetical protein